VCRSFTFYEVSFISDMVLRCASLTDLRANIMADLDSIQSAASTVQSASLLSSSLFSSSEEQADPLEHVDTLITSLAGAANGWETGLVLSQRPPTVLGLSSWQKGLFEVWITLHWHLAYKCMGSNFLVFVVLLFLRSV